MEDSHVGRQRSAGEQIHRIVDGDAETLLEREASASLWKENRQVLALAAVVVAFLAIAHLTPLKSWLESGQQWKHYIDEFGLAAHLVFGGASALAVMFGMPRLPLCSVAGAVFGFKEGLVISWLSSTLWGVWLLSPVALGRPSGD